MKVPRGQLLAALLDCKQLANEGRADEIQWIVDEVIQEEDRKEMTDLEKLAQWAVEGNTEAALEFMKAKARQNKE